MAFGQLGKLGARGGFGSLGALGKASTSPAGPTAPVLAITSLTSDNTPEFNVDAAWVDQDVLQFEYQTAGGNWSGATISNHTVTSGEITGTVIDFTLGALANGSYDYRCKFKHSGGSYSGYSNVVTATISASTFVPTFELLGF